MQFIKQRENDPEYLKSVIAQKQIIVQQEKRRFEELTKQQSKLKNQYDELMRQKQHKEDSSAKEINNLNLAIKEYESEVEILKHEKNELEFMLNNTKVKLQEFEREHNNEIEKLTMDFETQKELLTLKIGNLQKNFGELKKYYKVEEQIVDDKKKIIEDSNRDLRGFSNEKQQRLLIIQNQQYKNEIEYQSKNLTIQLEKNEKFLEEIKSLKIEVQLHKEIQADLVKRSSLAQILIKKLYKEIQQSKKNQMETENSFRNQTPESSREDLNSKESNDEAVKEKDEAINKLKFELASAKNYNHYMENVHRNYSKKYETLGSLLSDYLENLLYSKDTDEAEGGSDTILNIHELRSKDIKQWKFEQIEAVVHLLLTQLKPFISKSSLTTFPEVKNINISFVEQQPKEMISLPKIADNYEKSYQKEAKKGQNRFKDIPIDISTKILRSNLREWGSKIKYGNMPVVKKMKSKSIAQQNQKSFL